MKTKLVVLSCAVASLALLSFMPQISSKEKTFANINNISFNPSKFKGNIVVKDLLHNGRTLDDGPTTNDVTAASQDPPQDQLPKELKRIIKKYN